jgi:hypothetical protein
MDRRQISLKLTLDALGVKANTDTLDERLRFQAAVYLAQAAGLQLGYPFGWCLGGPYCPQLTRDAFVLAHVASTQIDESMHWTLDTVSLHQLNLVRKLCTSTTSRKQLLKWSASIHFLVQRGKLPSKNPERLRARLAQYGENLSCKQVANTIGALVGSRLLSRQGKSATAS